MDMITQWTYGSQPVRTVTGDDDAIRFVAKDVCEVLDLADTSMSVKSLDDDEKGTSTICTPGGDQEVLTVTEAGLYRLVFQSRKPEAKAFRRWVMHEVLPAIRKNGGYGNGANHLEALATGARKMRAKLAELDVVAGAFIESYDETKKRGDDLKDAVKHGRRIFEGLPAGPPQTWFYIWLVVKIGNTLQIKTGISTNLAATEQEYKRQNPKGKWLLRKVIAADVIADDLESEIQDRVLPQEMRLRGAARLTESFDIPEYLLTPFIWHCEPLTELTIAGVQAYKRPQTLWG